MNRATVHEVEEAYRPDLPEFHIPINPDLWRETYRLFEPCIQLYTTMTCSLLCDKCFVQRYLTTDRSSILPLNVSKAIIDNNPLVTRYDSMGGEPGLDPNIEPLISYLVSKGKSVDIFTNAFAITKFLSLPQTGVRFRITTYSLDDQDLSRKPLLKLEKNIRKIAEKFPVVLNYLMDQRNDGELRDFLRVVKDKFPFVQLVKIGCARDEKDYANDNNPGVLAFARYASIISQLLNDPHYYGPANLNIFAEGVLYTDKMPQHQPNQLGRFKSVFASGLARGLYAIDRGFIKSFDPHQPIDFAEPIGIYAQNGREWTDQIQVQNRI